MSTYAELTHLIRIEGIRIYDNDLADWYDQFIRTTYPQTLLLPLKEAVEHGEAVKAILTLERDRKILSQASATILAESLSALSETHARAVIRTMIRVFRT